MRRWRWWTFPLLLATAVGCGQAKPAPPPATDPNKGFLTEQSLQLPSLGRAGKQAEAPVPRQASSVVFAADAAPAEVMTAARKLVRAGQLTLEVKKYADAAAEVARAAQANGGYLAESRSHRGDEGRDRGTLTLRVPADRFDSAFAALKALGRVRSEGFSTQDVTKAYTDLETRLRVKREAEARMRTILKTQTGKLSDVVEAEREIARITEEIEQLEGERRYYEQQVALSTITVELLEPLAIVHGGALEPIKDALGEALVTMSNSIASIIYAFVFALPWVVALALLWRLVRAIRTRRQT